MAEVLHRFDTRWIEVGRTYRRICFLRSEGLTREAQRVETNEFAEAAARARGLSASEPEADSLLRGLMAEEEERVAGAIAFAEVLVPLLARRLSAHSPAPFPHAASPALGTAAGREGGTRDVADFIDEMLAQERLESR
jgi:hypothetical protein